MIDSKKPDDYEIIGRDISFANTLIVRGVKEGLPLTNLHLQKLMYIVYGYCLVRHKIKPGGVKFQPWDLGPVVESVYNITHGFGSRGINDYCTEFDPVEQNLKYNVIAKEQTDFYVTFDEAWKKYRHRNVWHLVKFTHQPGFAWDKARRAHAKYLKVKDIEEEYKAIVSKK